MVQASVPLGTRRRTRHRCAAVAYLRGTLTTADAFTPATRNGWLPLSDAYGIGCEELPELELVTFAAEQPQTLVVYQIDGTAK